MSINARGCSPQDILSNRRHFKVANYQRKCEWSIIHIERLLDDLFKSFDAAKGGKTAFHFIGSFILQKKAEKEQIVDGQQRLTSLSIMLAVARDRVTDPDLKKEFDTYITDSARSRSAPPVKRIEHHRGDEDHFDQFVVRVGATTSLSTERLDDEQAVRMRDNVQYTLRRLRTLESDSEIREFVVHVMEKCKVIEITLDGDDDPFPIFVAVNSRGQQIRQQDVVRVTLIDNAAAMHPERRALLSRWDKAESTLGAENFERYLLLRHCAATGRIPDDRSFIKDMHTDFTDAAAIKAFVSKGLQSECEAYRSVIRRDIPWGGRRQKEQLNNTLYSLSLVSFDKLRPLDEWRPLAVSILTKYERNYADALGWLRKLETLVWYWFLDSGGKYDVKDRVERFHSIATYFKNRETWIQADSNIELKENEKGAILAFLGSRLDEDLPELRSLLLRLEQALRSGTPARNITGDFTVEHVLPRSGGGTSWSQYLEISDVGQIKDLSRRLGNLCFVTRDLNEELGEQLFEDKKRLAVEAKVGEDSRLANALCVAKDWKKTTIDECTKSRVELLASCWGL